MYYFIILALICLPPFLLGGWRYRLGGQTHLALIAVFTLFANIF